MTNTVLETIRKHNMINCGDRVIAAVSGGADSAALLTVLCELRQMLDIEVFAANLNHNLRPESDDDTNYVKELCKKTGVKLFCRSLDIKKIAEERGIGEEECGRIERYRFFDDAAREIGGAKIATGHHVSDNAETVLFHLARGSGLKGLSGISYVRGNIIRPLLDVKKSEIEDYLNKKGIAWRTDKTNFDVRFARNRIRINVLPELEKIFPNAQARISRTAGLISSDEDFLAREAEKSKAFEDGYIYKERLLPLHESLIRRVMLSALGYWNVKEIDYKKEELLRDIALGPTGRRADLGGGVIIENVYGRTGIAAQEERDGFLRRVKYGENIKINFSFSVIEVKSVDKCDKMSDNNTIAVYDADKLPEVDIRFREDGDYICLTGGAKKLKKLFIDEKIPRGERDALPLAAVGHEVVFVPTVRISAKYRPDKNTERFLVLSYAKKKGSEKGVK